MQIPKKILKNRKALEVFLALQGHKLDKNTIYIGFDYKKEINVVKTVPINKRSCPEIRTSDEVAKYMNKP